MTTPPELLDDYAQWKHWSANGFGHCSRGDARYFAWHLAHAHPGPLRRALEIGFGNGSLLGHLRSLGVEAVGIEIQSALRERGAQAGFRCHASVNELAAGETFDLIAALDVLEHIERTQIPALMHRLERHLAPGGVLLLRVPNGESPFGRMFQHGDLTHCTTLGLSAFGQLAAASGLRVLRHGEMPWYAAARNPKRLARGALQRLIERCVAFAYHWDADALAPNLVVVLGRAETSAAQRHS